MDAVYHVGMADIIVTSAPATLVTLGLGSCIGLVLFDTIGKVAGMAHIMLPESHSIGGVPVEKPGKFADTAVPVLIDEVCKRGALRSRLKAKMAGGAQMFSLAGNQSEFLAVGARNIRETTEMLRKCSISLVSSDTGGNRGRSVEFSTLTWVLAVKTLGKGRVDI
jgi:chemotaxis protein CheD